MGRLEVGPFTEEHLDDASGLLAARHARQRRVEPLLPDRFERPEAAAEELIAVWRSDGASGAAAVRDGRLVGYLVGAPRDREDWGENVWIGAAGHAVEEAEDVRDLYGLAAAGWVEEGHTRHYALVPATDDELVDAWFRLGFGHQQAHGVQALPESGSTQADSRFEIREATVGDAEAVIDLDLALAAHQGMAPVFSGRRLQPRELLRAEFEKALSADDERILVGCVDGRPVACWSVCDAALWSDYGRLALPERACYLGFASTLPGARGTGLGVALTEASLAAAREDGYEAMVTDWRVSNLLASRFWPRRGFRPAFFRLYRSIP